MSLLWDLHGLLLLRPPYKGEEGSSKYCYPFWLITHHFSTPSTSPCLWVHNSRIFCSELPQPWDHDTHTHLFWYIYLIHTQHSSMGKKGTLGELAFSLFNLLLQMIKVLTVQDCCFNHYSDTCHMSSLKFSPAFEMFILPLLKFNRTNQFNTPRKQKLSGFFIQAKKSVIQKWNPELFFTCKLCHIYQFTVSVAPRLRFCILKGSRKLNWFQN